ncbi:prolyl-tRNA synthetase [Corynespora cassiicola Philippines]|uniref:proline--tRNA ligase n=1 Tax=Corynespora cassiicola Philippines TaxID=1448308 RepID=A0A2T2P5E6_CORCC|nr:prolyl-tRNA synthetase [Corynespora cassiicola Philippines]
MAAHMWRGLNRSRLPIQRFGNARFLTLDSRNRLSKFWAPTGGIAPQDGEQDDSHALLIRGGFLRQAHSGVFHLLPLGLRVQDKLERLIDHHMATLGASKLTLSSLSTETLWQQSGRYSSNSELLRIADRRNSGFLLSPTHEEEITALVAGVVHSYKDLPLRLYQIGRKYRDEKRPRQGLLRAKEFLMKDLYTFDVDHETALQTYGQVLQAYRNLFDALKLPYLVADADSGNMGGKLSHEFHFPSPKGEDRVFECGSDACSYVANEELVSKSVDPQGVVSESRPLLFMGISKDRETAVHIAVPRLKSFDEKTLSKLEREDGTIPWEHAGTYLNLHAVKRSLPSDVELDTGIEPSTLCSLLKSTNRSIHIQDSLCAPSLEDSTVTADDLTTTNPGDTCPKCAHGTLTVQKAIEVGHTFHLGMRYSEPLSALIAPRDGKEKAPVHMGCHGIGVSRLLAAIASQLADSKGLNWPSAVAPFSAVIVPTPQVSETDAASVYDQLGGVEQGMDVVLDDRPNKGMGFKLQDADLIGYPVIVVIGRAWKERGEVEVQCRRLGVKKEVKLEGLKKEVEGLLENL